MSRVLTIDDVEIGQIVTVTPVGEASGEPDILHGRPFVVVSKKPDMMGNIQLALAGGAEGADIAWHLLRTADPSWRVTMFRECFPSTNPNDPCEADYSVIECVELETLAAVAVYDLQLVERFNSWVVKAQE